MIISNYALQKILPHQLKIISSQGYVWVWVLTELCAETRLSIKYQRISVIICRIIQQNALSI